MSRPASPSESDDDREPGLLSSLTDNWQLKVTALLISLGLYVVLHGGGESLRTLEVDLVRGPDKDPNKVLLTPMPPRAHVTVQGPRALIDDLANPLDALNLNLDGQPPVVRLEDYSIKLPPGVRKISISPTALNLRWDTKLVKRVKVEPSFSERPELLTIKAGSITVNPPTVSLTGPKTRIDPLQNLHTATVEITDKAAGTHLQSVYVDLAAAGLIDGNVTVDPEQVEVRFELVAETKTKTFGTVPVSLLKAKGVTIRPRNVSVIVTCPPKKADDLKEDAIVPKIDLEALGADFAKKGPEEADVKVELPTGCTDVVISPPRVVVTR